ncbi:MAG TPA: carboxypeptidase-like regulatory domain-containing protein, partial [Acidobacteriota bacterium]
MKGKVVNEKGEPVVGATVTVKGTTKATSTDEKGEFILTGVDENATLVVSSVSNEKQEIKVDGRTEIGVQLKTRVAELAGVAITVNTGYQEINPGKATGSFSKVGNDLFNRRVSTNTIDRIENLVPGVLFNKGGQTTTGGSIPDPILIRGRSTIYANAAPLIVLDNFPYDGDINDINPNDIESISILKDAAAASIWGARAGNGVIVISTKKGKASKPQVEFNSNVTIQGRPDLDNIAIITSNDYIELEKFLFSKGYYDNDINNSTGNRPPLSPVIEILTKQKNGSISPSDADNQINLLKQNNAREDLDKYFYRLGTKQQYALSISANTPNINYFMSVGWDHNNSNVVGQQYDRVSFRTQNTFRITSNFQIDGGIYYVQTRDEAGNNPGYNINSGAGKRLYPYADL